ncbi:hypothetical protein WH43_14385 [Rheinheimera sp. KL1]|nr:hypothetical protein WH43_14385 [Rheinheimera sp. KL1]
MKIILSLKIQESDDEPPLINGECITFRGVTYDLSPLAEAAELDIGKPFRGPIKRELGQIICTLEYGYSTQTAEFEQNLTWEDCTFVVDSGVCPCPVIRKPVPAISELNELEV